MNPTPRDDEPSASDWLAAQFGDEEAAPERPSGTVPPAAVPPATAPPATPVPPVATVPPAAPAGGFSWGLRPGGATTPPSTPVPPAAAPPVVPHSTTPPQATPQSAPPQQTTPPQQVTPPQPAPHQTPPPLIEPSEPPPTVAWTPPATTPPPVTPPAPAGAWDVPTQLMGAVSAPDAAPEPAAPAPAPTEPLSPSELAQTERLGSAGVAQDAATTSALESLFAEENFRDYTAEPVVAAPVAAEVSEAEPAGKGEISRTQKILLGVAGGLVAMLALAALFLLGTRLPALIGPAAAPLPSSTPTPSPTPTELPVGPVEPGVWAWDELLGGECLADYEDPWAEEFTVVDCAEPHPAQMVYRGEFPPSAEGVTNDPFPGTETLNGQLSILCSAPGVVDLAVAGQYTDVQLSGSYPVTAEQWDAGDRSYYCFVSRSSGEPLTGTLAVPPPAPVEEEPAA
ncbi:MAG TPA: septum formation family protein [Protaetiibacter sp.]|nr:septum formation family protein [Protaetiibacter sp.]